MVAWQPKGLPVEVLPLEQEIRLRASSPALRFQEPALSGETYVACH
jgi:hypothetical protein